LLKEASTSPWSGAGQGEGAIFYQVILQIGKLKVHPGLALAPMAGITNHPFRLLAKEQGCNLLYSEMISTKGLLYDNNRNSSLIYFTAAERPIGLQIFGSDPQIMARGAAIIENLGPDFIDLNFGCPTRKITKNGDGGALMRDPERCSAIFEAVVRAVSCPVTVKLRTGWNAGSINVTDIAVRAEFAGIKAVTVHGRTVDQGYSGRADWEMIKKVKAALTIPVIGNGDVDSALAAEAMLDYCRCDGVMIGRAARGNPWIFREVAARLMKQPQPEPPTLDEIIEMTLRHFALLTEFKGEAAAAREMRRHASMYIRGIPGAAAARQKLLQVSSCRETEAILRELIYRRIEE
jgi:tRNA-dihydrouridine synthase B